MAHFYFYHSFCHRSKELTEYKSESHLFSLYYVTSEDLTEPIRKVKLDVTLNPFLLENRRGRETCPKHTSITSIRITQCDRNKF